MRNKNQVTCSFRMSVFGGNPTLLGVGCFGGPPPGIKCKWGTPPVFGAFHGPQLFVCGLLFVMTRRGVSLPKAAQKKVNVYPYTPFPIKKKYEMTKKDLSLLALDSMDEEKLIKYLQGIGILKEPKLCVTEILTWHAGIRGSCHGPAGTTARCPGEVGHMPEPRPARLSLLEIKAC